MKRGDWVVVAVLSLGIVAAGGGCKSKQPEKVDTLPPDRVVAPGSADDSVTISKLTASDTLIEGTVTNNSVHDVNDVHLLVNHSFLWKNERNPGKNNPSRTEYYRVAKTIPPGAAMTFQYRPDPPLPKRNDGAFVTTVEVVSFAEIGK